MEFRSEFSLEELLTEPMVVRLMRRDGVSIGEARTLYARIGQKLRENGAKSRPANSPSLAPESSHSQNCPCI
jgi:hypothetical protein